MRNTLLVGFILLSILPCSAQRYNPIQFDSVNRNTSAKELFLKNIIAKDLTVYEDKNIKYNAVQAFEKFKGTSRASLLNIKNDKGKIIGNIYAVEKYIETDTIFKYENLRFNRFLIFSDIKNKTIAIKLYNENQNAAELNRFVEKYTAKNKNSNDSEVLKNSYSFKLADRTIIVKQSNQNESSPVSIDGPTPVPDNESSKPAVNVSTSIELIIIFDNLSIELKRYLDDNIYSQ